MARTDLIRRRDLPQTETASFPAGAGGTAADAATFALITPLPDPALFDLPNMLNEGAQGDIAPNRMAARYAAIVQNTANVLASGATNYADFKLTLYRLGALQGVLFYLSLQVSTTVAVAVTATGVQAVTPASMNGILPGTPLWIDNAGTAELVYVISTTATTFTANFKKTHTAAFGVVTALLLNQAVAMVPAKGVSGLTSATTISAGSQVVTPNTNNGVSGMYGIHVGDYLYVAGGTGAAETVQVTAVTATTFTATFANGHSGAYTITTTSAGGPLTTGLPALTSGVNYPFEILPGDVLRLDRLSNNVTGLATNAGIVTIDWVPSRLLTR